MASLLTCVHRVGLRIDELHFGPLGQRLLALISRQQLQLGVRLLLLLLLQLLLLLVLLLVGKWLLLDLRRFLLIGLQVAANVRLLLLTGTVRCAQAISAVRLRRCIVVLCGQKGGRGAYIINIYSGIV